MEVIRPPPRTGQSCCARIQVRTGQTLRRDLSVSMVGSARVSALRRRRAKTCLTATSGNASLQQFTCNGEYDACLASPPSGTYSAARSHTYKGPRQLRGHEMPELRRGLDDLMPEEKDDIKASYILTDRTSETLKWFSDNGRPWCLEQPARRHGKPSMLNLPQFKELSNGRVVKNIVFLPCMLSQRTVQKGHRVFGYG